MKSDSVALATLKGRATTEKQVWRRALALRMLLLCVALLCAAPASVSAAVRVGVLGLFHPRELTVRSGDGREITLVIERQTCVLSGREKASIVLNAGAVRASCRADSLSGLALSVAGRTGGAADVEIGIPGRIARRYRGVVSVTVADGSLVPVVAMDLETAVASVVAAEAVDGTPVEALKAQAVAARSYFIAARGRHRHFDFCDTTHCQFLRQAPDPGQTAERAVRATAGLVLSFRGVPIAALYSASCGGRTRSLAEAGFPATDGYPYFSVECSYCRHHAAEWESRVPLDEDARRLDADRSERARLVIGRRNGWSAVPGNNFESRRDSDELVLHGRGAGHGVGMCQLGAAARARDDGAAFSEILRHYYPGTTLTNALR